MGWPRSRRTASAWRSIFATGWCFRVRCESRFVLTVLSTGLAPLVPLMLGWRDQCCRGAARERMSSDVPEISLAGGVAALAAAIRLSCDAMMSTDFPEDLVAVQCPFMFTWFAEMPWLLDCEAGGALALPMHLAARRCSAPGLVAELLRRLPVAVVTAYGGSGSSLLYSVVGPLTNASGFLFSIHAPFCSS